jgi:hypothetical protein
MGMMHQAVAGVRAVIEDDSRKKIARSKING